LKTWFKKFFRLLFLVVLFCKINLVFAQDPCFTFIGDSVACAPFTANVFSCASGPNLAVSFNSKYVAGVPGGFINLPQGVNTASFTYPDPGIYTIAQITGNGTTLLTRKVRFYNKETKPTFFWTTCKDTLIIQFQDTVFSSYRFNAGDGVVSDLIVPSNPRIFKYPYSFSGSSSTFTFTIKGNIPSTCNQDVISNSVSLYKTVKAPVCDILSGIDTAKFKMQMQVRADEPYAFEFQDDLPFTILKNGISADDKLALEETISIPQNRQKSKLRAVSINGCGQIEAAPEFTLVWPILKTDNQKIFVSWPRTSTLNLVLFELQKDNVKIQDLLNYSDTSYIDSSNLVCGQTYCYKLVMKMAAQSYAGQMLYVSPSICGQAVSNRPPDAISNLTGTITDSGIVIKGLASPLAKTYEVLRKEMSEESYSKIIDSEVLPVVDKTADFMNRAYCYKLSFKDICGNQAIMSDSICPVWLRLELPNESEKAFIWTDFLGWKGGVDRYELIRLADGDAPELTDVGLANSQNIIGRDPGKQELRYQIRAFPKNVNLYPEPSYSNPVSVTQQSKFRFPDVFTPNEDGFNETFKCYPLYIKDFELKIFNAWGSAIFYANKVEKGWDGKIDSKPAASGPYAYWAKGVDEEGKTIEARGYFTLVR